MTIPGDKNKFPADIPAMRLLPRRGGFWRRAVDALAWSYLLAVLAVWGMLALLGDRWWFATVLLFAPRWIFALPLLVLVPLAAVTRRWAIFRVLAAALVIAVWPIMELCLPVSLAAKGTGPTVRVLTLNIDGTAGDIAALKALLEKEQPDFFAVQECPLEVGAEFFAPWHVRRNGQLVVGSRWPVSDVHGRASQTTARPWANPDALCVRAMTPDGPVRFCGIHLATPRDGLDMVLSRKIGVAPWRKEELAQGINDRNIESLDVTQWLRGFEDPLIVAGDFNMPEDSGIYADAWGSYANAFSQQGWGYGYTKWTPLRGFHYGLRIDHILSDRRWQPRRAWVGPDMHSDHLPMLADLQAVR